MGTLWWIDTPYTEEETLKPIGTFYERKDDRCINTSVAAGLLSPNLLYFIPCHRKQPSHRDTVSEPVVEEPCMFDLSKKEKITKQGGIQAPLATKTDPIVLIRSGNRLFALSSPGFTKIRYPDPCFESLDVALLDDDFKTRSWTPLDHPPFLLRNINTNTPKYSNFFLMGIAVLEHEDLILISFEGEKKKPAPFSYNIRSEKWSTVETAQTSYMENEDRQVTSPYLLGQAAVVKDNIYTYDSWFVMLQVFPYTRLTSGSADLSLGLPSLVKGAKFQHKFDDFTAGFFKTCTVTKVDDEILCLIHTMAPYCGNEQRVCVTFVHLIGDGKTCTTLKSFICSLFIVPENCPQTIVSCFIMNDLEEERDHQRGKRPVMPSDADDKASIDEPMCDKGEDAHEVDDM